MRKYVGSENLIMYGVVKVVSTDTATAMGYRKLLVTLSVNPSEAMINENSPICERLIPDCTDVLSDCPAIKAPAVTNNGFPISKTTVAEMIGM